MAQQSRATRIDHSTDSLLALQLSHKKHLKKLSQHSHEVCKLSLPVVSWQRTCQIQLLQVALLPINSQAVKVCLHATVGISPAL
jgi:hypothetical protein